LRIERRKRELRERELQERELREREQRGDVISSIWAILYGKEPSQLPDYLQSRFEYDNLAQEMARRVELASCLGNAIREYREFLSRHGSSRPH